MKKVLRILIIGIGIVGLLFELYAVEFVNTPYTNWDGVKLLKYFTIQSNIIVIVYFFILSRSEFFKPNEVFKRYIGSVTLSITVTFIVFAIFLQPTWNPTGFQYWSSIILHYVVPILTIFYFIRYFREFEFKRTDYRLWVAYPILYVVFALINGSITGDYLYPFLDLNANSTGTVLMFVLIIAAIYIGLSMLIILLNIRIRKPLEKIS